MVLLSLVGLAVPPAQAGTSKPCWVPTRMRYAGRDDLSYVSLVDAQQREADVARMERRDPREIRAGWLSLELNRLTLDGADPVHQLFIVTKDGQEVLRHEPTSMVPDVNPEVYQYWLAYAVVQLPEGVAPPLEVTVVDRLHEASCVWSVDEAGVATVQPRPKGKTDGS